MTEMIYALRSPCKCAAAGWRGGINLPPPGFNTKSTLGSHMSFKLMASFSTSKKKTILILRSLLILSAWALYSTRPGSSPSFYGHALFLISTASNLALMGLRESYFFRTRFTFTLLLIDTLITSILLYGQSTADYGVFLIFFFMILLAAAGQTLKAILATGVSVGAIYVLMSIHFTSLDTFLNRSDLLLKIPFLLVVSIFYGYFVEENHGLSQKVEFYARRVEHYGAEIQKTYWEALKSLINALDLRDTATQHHSLRVTAYTLVLCRVLGIPEEEWPDIERGALLHDIGKIGISDSILLKEGPLTDEEWATMKCHTLLGYQIVRDISFLKGSTSLILHHHERYDGTGYPFALRGEAIPLSARIFAAADAIDAICSGRPYKKKQGLLDVANALLKGAGKQFDPRVVQAYFHVPRAQWEQLQLSLEGDATAIDPVRLSQQIVVPPMPLDSPKLDGSPGLPPGTPPQLDPGDLTALLDRSVKGTETRREVDRMEHRVLVVDDEEVMRTFLKQVLEARGYKVDVAHNAAEGLQKVISQPYSVAILDYLMPGGDGKCLYKQIQIMNPELAGRALLITAAAFDEPLNDFLARSSIPFLRKPFAPEEVVHAVRILEPTSA